MFDTDTTLSVTGVTLSAVGMTATHDVIATIATILSCINAAIILARLIIRAIKAVRAHKAGKTTTDDFIAQIGGILDDAQDAVSDAADTIKNERSDSNDPEH